MTYTKQSVSLKELIDYAIELGIDTDTILDGWNEDRAGLIKNYHWSKSQPKKKMITMEELLRREGNQGRMPWDNNNDDNDEE